MSEANPIVDQMPEPENLPAAPIKPLHELPIQVVKAEALKYFGAPRMYKERRGTWYCIDDKTRQVWGSGYCVAAAIVDGISKMEIRKKRAREEFEKKQKEEGNQDGRESN